MTQRDLWAVALVATLLGLGPVSALAQGPAGPSTKPPTLSWQPPREARAASFRVRVLPVTGPNQLGRPVWEKAGLTAPTVRYAGPPLDVKLSYAWIMEALDARGRTLAVGGGILAGGAAPPPGICHLYVSPSATKICQGQVVTFSGFLLSGQTGPTSYVLVDGTTGLSTSGLWSGSVSVMPTATTTYTLTVTRGNCHASATFTITVVPQPSLGPGTPMVGCSEAPTQSTPFSPSQTVDMCCGSGLQCQAVGPVVGNVQWTAGNAPISGGTGAGVNINPANFACNPNQTTNTTTVIQATASTDPSVCPNVTSNPVSVTVHPNPQLGGVSVTHPVICADGVSTSQIGPLQSVVGTVTWTHQPGCTGPQLPFNPSSLPFTVGPLTAPDCYTVTVANGSCAPIVQNVRVDIDTPPVAGTITATPNPLFPCPQASVLTLNGSSGGSEQWYSSTTCTPGAVFASPLPGATGLTENTNLLSTTTCYGVQVSSLLGVCPPVQGPIVPVTVQSLPPAPVVTGPSVLCPGQTVTLSSSSSGQWYHNGDPVGPPPFMLPGNYWMETPGPCGPLVSNILTVNPDLLTVKIQGPCCDCHGGKVQLCATAMLGSGTTSFAWSTGSGSAGVGPCIQVQPTATTTYTVTATDAFCSVSTSFIVTVCP